MEPMVHGSCRVLFQSIVVTQFLQSSLYDYHICRYVHPCIHIHLVFCSMFDVFHQMDRAKVDFELPPSGGWFFMLIESGLERLCIRMSYVKLTTRLYLIFSSYIVLALTLTNPVIRYVVTHFEIPVRKSVNNFRISVSAYIYTFYFSQGIYMKSRFYFLKHIESIKSCGLQCGLHSFYFPFNQTSSPA